jgi:hypothetical protein
MITIEKYPPDKIIAKIPTFSALQQEWVIAFYIRDKN